jgi:hypothetical protein
MNFSITPANINLLAPLVNNLFKFLTSLVKRGRKMNLDIHPLFVRANLNKSNIRIYFTLPNKGKEAVFKDILCQHMDIYNKHAKVLCEKYLSKEIDDNDKLYEESVKALDGILVDLTAFYIQDQRYTQQEKIALDIVMSKYNHWNHERQMDVANRMLEVCNSAFYPSLNNKVVAVLDSFMFAMNDTVSDANKTLNSINGDLKGLIFKGVEI